MNDLITCAVIELHDEGPQGTTTPPREAITALSFFEGVVYFLSNTILHLVFVDFVHLILLDNKYLVKFCEVL